MSAETVNWTTDPKHPCYWIKRPTPAQYAAAGESMVRMALAARAALLDARSNGMGLGIGGRIN